MAFNYVNVRMLLPAAASPWLLLLLDAGVFGLLAVWVLWKHGALAFAVSGLTSTLPAAAPWTSDMSRWYAWRGPFMMAIIAALVIWGFRNVLGKQSAFPAGALD